MSDRVDTRDTRDNTRESGSMFDPRAERADTHTRGAPTGPPTFVIPFSANPTSLSDKPDSFSA